MRALVPRAAEERAAPGRGPGGPAEPTASAGAAWRSGARSVAVALAGTALGLAATALVLSRGWDPGTVRVGPWSMHPGVGTPSIDPYARAGFARTGEVPLAANEGLVFTAATDDTGFRLLRGCTYAVGGGVPAARFWTLTATDEDGRTLDGPARRSSFASNTVTRDIEGRFSIAVSAEARPGDWLPASGTGPMLLTLRLYGTPLAGGAGGVADAVLPSIARLACAAAAAPGPGDKR